MKTGLILDEKSVDYHATDAVSSSRLADMRVAGELCPRNYFVRHVEKSVPKKDAAHFQIGIATHLAILEGDAAFDTACVMQPDTYKNEKGEVKPWHNGANVCKAWYAGAAGRIVLTKAEADLILRMQTAVRAHPEAHALISAGKSEVTFRTVLGGMTLQCRADKWSGASLAAGPRATIVDLKTCRSLETFEREFYFLRYNVRAEFYRLVVSEVLAEIAGVAVDQITPPDYLFVVVEKATPHRVKVYAPDDESLDAGRKEVHADLLTLRGCLASGKWPTNTGGVQSIGLKSWQLAKSDATSEAAISSE